MIKQNELREKSTKELNERIKDLDYEQSKTEVYMKGLGAMPKRKDKTSLKRDLRRLRSKILTILNERKREENEN